MERPDAKLAGVGVRRDFRLGGCVVQPSLNRLVRGRSITHLRPQAMDLLVILAARVGRVTSKQELLDALWPDSLVSESALTTCMTDLRDVLAAAIPDATAIENIPKRGYRLVLPVEWVQPSDPAADEMRSGTPGQAIVRAVRSRRDWKRRMLVTTSLVVVGLAVLTFVLNVDGVRRWWQGRGGISGVRSLAVLPFENLSSGVIDSDVADGMAEELMSELRRISPIELKSRLAVDRYRGERRSPSAVGRELGVDAVLAITIHRVGDRLTFTAELSDARSEAVLWTERRLEERRDALALQNDIARWVADRTRSSLRSSRAERPAAWETTEDYLRARDLVRRHNEQASARLLALLEDVVRRDPGFARAHGLLALSYAIHAFNFEPEREEALVRKGEQVAARALELDPENVDALVAKGRLLWTRRLGFPHLPALELFRRALRISPGSEAALADAAMIYDHVGLFGPAEALARRAVELSPEATRARLQLGFTLLWQGRAAEALDVLQRMQPGANPSLTASHSAWALEVLARYREAASAIDQALTEYPQDLGGELHAFKAFLLARDGAPGKAEVAIEAAARKAMYGHFHHTAYFIACAYAEMNRTDAAIEWFERAALPGWPCYPLFERDPHLDRLRGADRFRQVLGAVKREFDRLRGAIESMPG